MCEQAGIPSSSLVCEGFIGQAAATTIGLGMKLPVAFVPGHTGAQSAEVVRRNILDVTLQDVVNNLTGEQADMTVSAEPGACEVVCKGTFEEVNRTFVEREWSDGLPIVPPTLERIEAFLKHTDRAPDDVIGVILPDSRAATVWSVAVNGVMAGCKPEYMPILVALAEAMCDPGYGVEHSGNTPGGETLIILNGPIIQRLGFNYTQGVLRDGFQPNTSVGRFWRLYLRNVAGFLLHKNDKATFGNTWRVVLAENEQVIAKIGWEPNSVEMGHAAGDDTVTIARYTGGNLIANVSGSTPEEILPYLADALQRQISWQLTFTTGSFAGTQRPLVALSPILAETIAQAGWSKKDTKKYLFEHARIPAWVYERQMRDWNAKPLWSLQEDVKAGRSPAVFAESDDPNRLVPVVAKQEDIMIVVSGDPLRTNAYVFAHNGILGYPVAKKIRMPSR